MPGSEKLPSASAGPVASAGPSASASPSASGAQPTPSGSAVTPGPIPKVAVSEVERSNQFAARLLKEVARGSSTNTTLSPTSVRLAMSLVAQGAKGTTKSELATALELDAKDAAGEAARELA